jgi:excisionase family DNA binding protein
MKLLTTIEAAERLAVSRSKLYELLSTGKIKARKLGRCVRIADDEIERFIASAPQAEYGANREAA